MVTENTEDIYAVGLTAMQIASKAPDQMISVSTDDLGILVFLASVALRDYAGEMLVDPEKEEDHLCNVEMLERVANTLISALT